MEWSIVLSTTLGSVLSSGVVVAAVTLLGRSIVGQVLQRDLETHRVRLESQAERSLENLRHTLQRAAVEHETRFRRLQEKRAEVLEHMYQLLESLYRYVRVRAQVNALLQKPEAALFRELMERMKVIEEYYYPHAIWLSRETCNGINELLATYTPILGVQALMEGEITPDPSSAWRPTPQELSRKLTEVMNSVAARQTQLEDEFRGLLGITSGASVAQLGDE